MFLPRLTICALSLAGTLALADDAAIRPLVEYVQAHRDGEAPWSVDFAKLGGERAALPIGVFDSGIGGLTVMDAILQLDAFHNDTLQPGADGRPDFAGERFVYFGDQANMPYGNYPSQGSEDFLRELIVKDAVFLLGDRWRKTPAGTLRRDKPPVKAIVIACNTATAYGIEDIRAALAAWKLDVPVIGVIEAGARATAAALPDDGRAHGVAVLATVGTCASGAYPKSIGRATGMAGKSAPVVVQQGSAGLAGAIEGNRAFVTKDADGGARAVPYQGPAPDPALLPAYRFEPSGLLGNPAQLNSVPNYARYDVTTLLETHRQKGGPPIDTVVLGCTHFPLAKTELAEAFRLARTYEAVDGSHPYADIVAGEVQFIDPAQSTARELFRELARTRLRAKGPGADEAPRCEFFFSVPNPQANGIPLAADGSLENAYKTSRAVGNFATEDTVAIPLTADTLPESSAPLVRSLSAVWRQMQAAPATAGQR